MTVEFEVDGSFFSLPDGWEVEKPDEWAEQRKLSSSPFNSKGCDLVAVNDGEVWFVEVKDYSYPGAQVPSNLAETVGLKIFHTLAVFHAVSLWGVDNRKVFSRRVMSAQTAKICLAVELPDGGRRLQGVEVPLSHLKQKLKGIARKLNAGQPVVSNSHSMGSVPWEIRRNPQTRGNHTDR